jgi:hypothetical protein
LAFANPRTKFVASRVFDSVGKRQPSSGGKGASRRVIRPLGRQCDGAISLKELPAQQRLAARSVGRGALADHAPEWPVDVL